MLEMKQLLITSRWKHTAWMRPPSHLLDLEEVKLYRRLASEEGDEHGHLVAVGVDLADRPDELAERPADDLDRLANLVLDLGLGLGLGASGGRAQNIAQLAFR